MATFNISKTVSALPTTLVADTVYYVRTGAGFDHYVTNSLGEVVAYKVNSGAVGANSTALDGLTGAADRVPYFTGVGTLALGTLTTFGRTLNALADAAALKTLLTLGNVDNTSDASKPVSTATQTALNLKLDASATAAAATKLATARNINGVAFDGTADITLAGSPDATKLPLNGSGTMTGAINEAATVTIASAATVNIGAAASNTIIITGTTTISSFGAGTSGMRRQLTFSGALNVTQNATSMILPGAATITTAAGDTMDAICLGSSNWRITNYTKGTTAVVGIVNFTDTLSSIGTNATVAVSSWTAKNASFSNMDIAIIPKGTGAVLASIPDGAAAGGNKRGTNSVDFQTARTSGVHVASGNNAVIVGGGNNRASADYSSTLGGYFNAATGQYSIVGGGSTNSASGNSSVVLGGSSNTSSGNSSAIIGGTNNTSTAGYSSFLAAYQGHDRGSFGATVKASGAFSTGGDAQARTFVMRGTVVGAASVVLTADGAAANATNMLILPDNSAFAIRVKFIVRDITTGAAGTVSLDAAFKRGAGAASTVIVGSQIVTPIATDAAASGWSVSATANTTLGGININAVTTAGANCKVVAFVETVEVVG